MDGYHDRPPPLPARPMSPIRYKQLDVFAARHGGGNPLGVVIDAEGWSDERMQRFAHWTNLVETTFLMPARAEGADYRARIFTPTKEIPFAGHPTIGSAHAALDAGLVKPDAAGVIWQECGAGVLPIRVEGTGRDRELFVQSPRARVVGDASCGGETLSAVLYGVQLGALAPACVAGGRRGRAGGVMFPGVANRCRPCSGGCRGDPSLPPASQAAAAGGWLNSPTSRHCAAGAPTTPPSALWRLPPIPLASASSHGPTK